MSKEVITELRHHSKRGRERKLVLALAAVLSMALATCGPVNGTAPTPPASRAAPSRPAIGTPQATAPPGQARPIGHVFIINLENKSYVETWGPNSKARYLATELRSQGVLLESYYAVAHSSIPNYIAQVSGQGANPATQDDCHKYAPMTGIASAQQAVGPGQAAGTGCIYPTNVQNIGTQLSAAGRTWKAYMEDMGPSCRHPSPGQDDPWQKADSGNQYATKHNPFVYFTSITGSPGCNRRVVDLRRLRSDLTSTGTTPELSYISPDLCNDGHDMPCSDGRPGGLETADDWLRTWVPLITSSPAFRSDGVLVITFDEAEEDGQECAPRSAQLPGMSDPDGGRVGALVLSRFAQPGAASRVLYNHYSLLASIEDIFHLPYLGYASVPELNHFGADIYRYQQ